MTNPSAEFSRVSAKLRLREQEFEKIMCTEPKESKTYGDFPSCGLVLKEISFFREFSKKVAKRI